MFKLTKIIVAIGIMAVSFWLQEGLAYSVSYEERIKERSLAIKTALVESAELLLSQELKIVKTIDQARYMYLETELSPIFPDFMADVVYLLEWALRIDKNDISANFLLGKVYYLRHDLAEGFADRNAVVLAKKHLSKVMELNSQSGEKLNSTDFIEAKKMLDELRKIPDGAFWEEPSIDGVVDQ